MRALLLSTSGRIESIIQSLLFYYFVELKVVISQNHLSYILKDAIQISDREIDITNQHKYNANIFKITLRDLKGTDNVEVKFSIQNPDLIQITKIALSLGLICIPVNAIQLIVIESIDYPVNPIVLSPTEILEHTLQLSMVRF